MKKLKPGQVFVSRKKGTRTPSRRIVAIGSTDGKVRVIHYCSGSNHVRACQPRAFNLWASRYAVVATRTRRPRSMVLR